MRVGGEAGVVAENTTIGVHKSETLRNKNIFLR